MMYLNMFLLLRVLSHQQWKSIDTFIERNCTFAVQFSSQNISKLDGTLGELNIIESIQWH